MNNLEFAELFAQDVEIALLYGFICALVNLWMFRRYIYSVFDPLFFFTVLSALGGSVVFYLHHFNLIRPFYFWSYLATQLAFTIGFLLIKPPDAVRSPRPTKKPNFSGPIAVMYPMSVILFVGAQLTVYSTIGLPIFLDSRLEAFESTNGFGIFSRIIFVTSNIAFICAIYRLAMLRTTLLSCVVDFAVVAFSIAVAAVSGSKGALLCLVFTASLGMFYARRFYGAQIAEARLQKFFFVMIMLALPVAFVTIYQQSGLENLLEIISVIAMRFFLTGDIYYMLYPNDVLARLQDGNGLLALFYSPLGALRIVPREALPINLGLQGFWYHYDTFLLSGPNARHNVFGLFYFGPVLSVVFSFLLGLFFSIARNTAYRRLPSTPVGMNLYVLVASSASYIEQDVSGQAIDYLFSVAIIFPALYAIGCLIRPSRLWKIRQPDSLEKSMVAERRDTLT